MRWSIVAVLVAVLVLVLPAFVRAADKTLQRIRVDRAGPQGPRFVAEPGGREFTVWGLNYDHDTSGRLLEDYWATEWQRVVDDFHEMKALGANTVRIHLQAGRFLRGPGHVDRLALLRLRRLVRLAEETGLYLDLTGLGCYHLADVPPWYEALGEAERWEAQALFWGAVAETCAGSPAVFCYDLMNEPIFPGAGKAETDWLPGSFGGKHFVQRLTLDLAGRSRETLADLWVGRMVAAIRAHDPDTLVTVGCIPWAYAFTPKADSPPLFHSGEAGRLLDFVSVHFYPKKGEGERALRALTVYAVGKPVVVEECFPLRCSPEEMRSFIAGSRPVAQGWMGFYWGTPPEELGREPGNLAGALLLGWLSDFRLGPPEVR